MSDAVREGYKQTEVGVIPQDWDSGSLKNVSVKITDGDHATPIRTESGYYLLSARNVLNGRISVSDVDYVGESEFYRMRLRCNPEAGDILISCSGTIGRVSVVPKEFECVLVRSAALVKLDPRAADSNFVQFWLQSKTAQEKIFSSVNQGAQPNLFINHIERIGLPIPPLPEQKAIASALADVDALLASLEALLTKKRQLKQAAMQELLTGKTRLEGFEGEWEEKRLGDVADVISGGTPSTSKPSFWNGSISWCTPTDLTAEEGKYLNKTERTITLEGLKNSAAALLPVGAILFCSRASIGEVKISSIATTTNQGFQSLVCGRQTDNSFLYYLIVTQRQRFIELAKGSTFLEISSKAVRSIVFIFPPLPEQQAIASILSEMDAEMEALEGRAAKTRNLKQGMMQELLTGRTRLV